MKYLIEYDVLLYFMFDEISVKYDIGNVKIMKKLFLNFLKIF